MSRIAPLGRSSDSQSSVSMLEAKMSEIASDSAPCSPS